MRCLTALLLLCSFTNVCLAQWPNQVDVGEVIVIELDDEPTIDINKNLGEAVKELQQWMQSRQQLVSAPEGSQTQLDLSVSLDFSLQASGLAWDASLQFSSDTAGIHVLVLEQNRKIQLHRITVGEGEPPPPPPPQPASSLLVTIVEETSESKRWVTQVARDPQVTAWEGTKHKIRRVDIDARDEHDKIPDDLLDPFSAASGKSLPFLVVQDRETGKVLFSTEMPQNPAELLGILRKYSK